MTLTPIDYFRATIAEGRMTQKVWSKKEDGKEYVCLAAAWGKPGSITSVDNCPVDLFPRWVFELMPTLDDGIAASEVPWLFQGFADRADKMAAFTATQWGSARTAFSIGLIDFAVDKARPVQPVPAPAYWQQVIDTCEQVKAALRTSDKSAAWSAAWAAKSAESTAKSAWWAAESAAKSAESTAKSAWWAAESAAKSAESTAKSAWWAAWSAEAAWWAAWSAKSAAYKEIASLFFACVDAQG